jgi:hypothetical protein
MESKIEGFLHTFLIVIACVALYNNFVKSFTPAPIVSLIGL